MTDNSPRKQVAKPKRIGPKPVFAAGVLTFAIFLGALGFQVASGKDPALGHGKQKPKIVHHSVKRVVVTKIYDAPVYTDPSASGYGGYSSGSGGSSGYSSGSGSGYSGGSSGYSSGSSGYSGGSSGSSGSSYSAPSYSAPAPSYSAPSVSTKTS
jgi:hypothetical protein